MVMAALWMIPIKDSTAPVSYTHLDVYKRQLLIHRVPVQLHRQDNVLIHIQDRNKVIAKGKMRISDGPRRAGATGYTKIAKTGAEAAGKVHKREMEIP